MYGSLRAGQTARTLPAGEGFATAAVLFPGQGSQAPAMGMVWRRTAAWELVDRAEAILERPLAAFLLDPRRQPTTTTDIQLSVLLTSLMAWQVLRTALAETGEWPPMAFAGHSLGQITALAAAEAISVEDAVRLVALRGALTERACRENPGGMVAVLGTEHHLVERACRSTGSWIANDNAPGQVVIAGTEPALHAARQAIIRLGGRKLIRLDVPGPFHTPLMADAARDFARHVRDICFAPPCSPIFCNTDAEAASPRTDWATELTGHLTMPVLWRQTQLNLAESGARSLVELGCGTTLTSIARRTLTGPRLVNVDGPSAVTAVAAQLRRSSCLPGTMR